MRSPRRHARGARARSRVRSLPELEDLIVYDAMVLATDPKPQEEPNVEDTTPAALPLQVARAFSRMLERGEPVCVRPERPDIPSAIGALITYVRDRDELELAGGWSMGPDHADACARAHGEVPGGFDALLGVVASGPWITIGGGRITAQVPPESVTGLGARAVDARLRATLGATLTPPGPVTMLFMLMGISMYWGIRVSGARHGDRALTSWNGGRPVPSGSAHVRAILEGVDACIGSIMDALGALPAGRVYPVDALACLVEAACAAGRVRIEEELAGVEPPRLPVFAGPAPTLPPDGVPSHKAYDLVARDLLPAYLVPAGIAYRPDEDTFGVFSAL